ncbi:MAG TPA: YncE family protein [Rhizomicrobium sp.]|jgi:YVTN family beta-propeller protein|nr:YncE family protein [Rhizomicrobium sp.]
MKTPRLLLAAAAALSLIGAAQALPGYHMLRSVTLGGDTFWDAITLDGVHQHLFITHGSHVVVVDSRTYAVLGDLSGVTGAHQVAVAPSRGFATSGLSNSVVVFDPASLKVTGTIAVGTRPDGVLYDPFTHRVFTFNAGSKDATVIDVASGTVDGTIPLGGKPEFAVTDGAGHVYDNIEDTAELVQIDPKKMEVVQRWPLAPCVSPSGLAIDKARARLFVACENEMMAVVDARTGKVLTTIPTGKGADGAAYDPVTRNVFIPNGEGIMTVIQQSNGDRYRVLQRLSTQFGARTIEIDPATHRIFTVTADLTPDPGKRPPYKMTPGSFRLLIYGK